MRKISGLSGLTGILLGISLAGCETVQSPTVKPSAWGWLNLAGSVAGVAGADKMTAKQAGILSTTTGFSGNMADVGNRIAIERAKQPQTQVNVDIGSGYDRRQNGHNPQQSSYNQQQEVYRNSNAEEDEKLDYRTAVKRKIDKRKIDKRNTFVFSCKYVQDFNNNGLLEFDEFGDIKDSFAEGEEFRIVLYGIAAKKGERTEIDRYNYETGKFLGVIDGGFIEKDVKNQILHPGIRVNELAYDMKYILVGKVGGRYIGRCVVNIEKKPKIATEQEGEQK